ncbi:ribosome biogenesis protein ALB1 [Scheffersomyces xylosifermentans]|uniref:ribosome biogenesis protein ALB1 n=1 Tax=Scheffersomyces xylosifermentans TaxID=1304137 RepID=UPI00315CFDD0
MASKNSINKPKIKISAHSHAKTLGKKRAARARKNPSSRSATERYSEKAGVAPRPTDSKAIALYTGEAPKPTGVVTNTTLSNKRAKKLARNQKYIDQRNSKTKTQEDAEMDIDEETAEEKQTRVEKVKAALWSVVENQTKGLYKVAVDGEGTTLGVQAF